MILTVEFPHEAHVILKRGRTEKRFFLKSHVEVKVEEVTAAEAPVALRWKPTHSNPPNGKMEVRWWDNCLWEPAYYSVSHELDTHVTAERLREMVASNADYANPLRIGYAHQLRDAKRMEDLDVRTIVSSERDKVAGHIQALAAGTLIVDGMVYKRSEEPVYVIHYGFHASFVSAERIGYATSSRRPDLLFRADRWDDAVAAISSRFQDDDPVDEESRIEILIPEVLRYDDETPAIREAAGRARDYMGERLKDADKEFMGAYADLRDVLRDGLPVEPDLILAMTAVAAVCEKNENTRHEVEALKNAVEKWHNRPVSVEEADVVVYPGLGA